MENNSKAAELTEFPVLTFAFYTVIIERQEHGAVDWHISEREGNMFVLSDCHSAWRETKFLILNYICNRENKVLKHFL